MTLLEHVYQHPSIPADGLREIIAAHRKISCRKGDFLLKEGQVADHYLILEKGMMRSFVHDYDRKDITTGFFSEQEVVIEVLSLFKRAPSTENIQALTDCECWRIDFDTFQKLFQTVPGFAEWGRLWMTNSLFLCKQRTLDMITISASERYLRLIREKPQIVLQVPLKQIASYLGITDTSFSRIRKEIS